MRNISALFNEFGAALQFPYYFGENANAFDECINDLDWLIAPGYVLIIHDADQLLVESTSPDEQTQSIMRILESAGEEWSRPIEDGVRSRPSKPFHVIFQTDSDKTETFRLRLKRVGVNLGELYL